MILYITLWDFSDDTPLFFILLHINEHKCFFKFFLFFSSSSSSSSMWTHGPPAFHHSPCAKESWVLISAVYLSAPLRCSDDQCQCFTSLFTRTTKAAVQRQYICSTAVWDTQYIRIIFVDSFQQEEKKKKRKPPTPGHKGTHTLTLLRQTYSILSAPPIEMQDGDSEPVCHHMMWASLWWMCQAKAFPGSHQQDQKPFP